MLPHRPTLFAGLGCTAMVAAFNLANLKLLKIVGDSLDNQQVDGLSTIAWLISLVFIGRAVFSFGQSFLISDATQKMTRDLRDKVYAHIQGLPLRFFEDRRTGQLMASITADVPVLQETFQSGMIDSISAPIMVVGTLAAMCHYSVRLTAVAIVLAPLMIVGIRAASRRMGAASRQIQENAQGISDVLQETIAGVRVIKSFTSEETETRRFMRRSQEALRASMRAVRVRAILAPTIELIGAGGFVTALLIGVHMVASHDLSTGDLMAFLLAVNQFGANARNLGNINLTVRRLDAAAERIFTLLDTRSDLLERPQAVVLDRAQGRIEFEHVCFAYTDGAPVLRDVSFEAEPGQVVALVGPSGAGKSTIANLVPRFYDVTGGSVRVDGRDIRDYSLFSLRSQIGIVPQETMLFSGTVRDNIRYGRPDAGDDEVVHAARSAHADGFIERLPNGYDTVVGERGAKLSGGQRQRVAIARAILKDPRILILDEATSALDTESEALVQEALNTLMKGRTTLVIAHRLSTIRNADRILVMRAGRIVEEGSHADLLVQDGLYARLYEMQFDPTNEDPPSDTDAA